MANESESLDLRLTRRDFLFVSGSSLVASRASSLPQLVGKVDSRFSQVDSPLRIPIFRPDDGLVCTLELYNIDPGDGSVLQVTDPSKPSFIRLALPPQHYVDVIDLSTKRFDTGYSAL